ncbi:MAG: 30S ribosomal protein S3 [Candidatus Omnitrophica bacterium]|nr:30S ribosomal protein S3 [Candidatus Omnitrophota bacterium]
MGQKVHPFILRVGILRTWQSRWFAHKKDFAKFIKQDYEIRKFIKSRFKQAAVSNVIIERLTGKVKVYIHSARPGIIIGRHGADIEQLRQDLANMFSSEVAIDIVEVNNPAIEAQLVAENIAFQIEKRVSYRRALKRAMSQAMGAGAQGVRVTVAGRLNGAEMSRTEMFKEGKIPLQTLRADIDYGFAEALTTYGLIGVKIWIYKGEVLGVRKDKNGNDAQKS